VQHPDLGVVGLLVVFVILIIVAVLLRRGYL
jgi:hypothetical protein